MHKHRIAARQQAWYTDSQESQNFNLNPFAKVRKTSIYAEPDDEEGPKPLDSDNFVAELVRRGTRKLTFVKSEHLDRKETRLFGSKTERPPLAQVDEEKPALSNEENPNNVQEIKPITWKQRAFLYWRHWRNHLTRLGIGNQWEVKPAIADVATSTIAFAPLSATGQYFLPASPRPQQTLVIEFQIPQSGTAGYAPL